MLRVWNVTLVIVTFLLTIFGTFMTRSGIVQSVHAFGEDRELAWMFTAFMAAILTFSFGWVIYRLPLLRSRHELDSWAVARSGVPGEQLDSAVLRAVRPVCDDVPDAERSGHRRAAHRGAAVLQQVDGADRPDAVVAHRARRRCSRGASPRWPTCASSSSGRCSRADRGAGALVALGVRVWSSGICFALCGFVIATLVQEVWRGARVRQEGTGTDVFTASSAWSAATSAATAATSSTSASC